VHLRISSGFKAGEVAFRGLGGTVGVIWLLDMPRAPSMGPQHGPPAYFMFEIEGLPAPPSCLNWPLLSIETRYMPTLDGALLYLTALHAVLNTVAQFPSQLNVCRRFSSGHALLFPCLSTGVFKHQVLVTPSF